VDTRTVSAFDRSPRTKPFAECWQSVVAEIALAAFCFLARHFEFRSCFLVTSTQGASTAADWESLDRPTPK